MDVQTLTLEYQFHIHLLKGGVSLHEQDLAGTSWEALHIHRFWIFQSSKLSILSQTMYGEDLLKNRHPV